MVVKLEVLWGPGASDCKDLKLLSATLAESRIDNRCIKVVTSLWLM